MSTVPSDPTLPIAAPPATSPLTASQRHVLDFDPARDGFGFVNTFAWTEEDLVYLGEELRPLVRSVTVALPALAGGVSGGRRGLVAGALGGAAALALRLPDAAIRGVARRWASFGLCGGMALAAAERWPARLGRPTAELKREHIRALLRRRQARTIRASGPTFIRYWLAALAGPAYALPFGDVLDRELAILRAAIDSGRPVVLGLVGDTPDPFAMHQVVAFGYEMDERGATRLSVYDPNSPGRTRHIEAHVDGGRVQIGTDLTTGPRRSGGYHISREPGRLSMIFAVEV
ncbi:MAG: hypothetical protein HKN04_07540 [Rhodothermaceae bacterium]|nr:hypothetical protein [Rhodothermaceae bacterium]